MDAQLFGFISSIVAGVVTNGIQGVHHYITKETLQDHIASAIEAVQLLYEKEFGYKGKSLFIWQKNIEYYACWLLEGFLPRTLWYYVKKKYKLNVDFLPDQWNLIPLVSIIMGIGRHTLFVDWMVYCCIFFRQSFM